MDQSYWRRSVGCGDSEPDSARGQAHSEDPGQDGLLIARSLAVRSPRPEGATLFERMSSEDCGVGMVNVVDNAHPLKRLYYGYAACGGIALGDFDGDGRVDLFCANGAESNRLYFQKEGWKFEDGTEVAGVGGGEAWGTGCTAVDIEGDGDLDLYVCNYDQGNHLFINDGKGRFSEQGAAHGLDIADASVMAYFADYDRDGDLDAYLLTYTLYREGGRPREILPTVAAEEGGRKLTPEWARYYKLEPRPGGYSFSEAARPDYLLRNEGGKFVEVTAASGIPPARELGNSAMWWDYDQDGWPDLLVLNDLADPDHLYRNEGGQFREVTAEVLPHTTWTSMGSASGDLNNDGFIDALVVDMLGSNHFRQKMTMGTMNAEAIRGVAGPPPQVARNTVFLNSGAGRMCEAAYLCGLAKTDWSWSPKLADFDCDGRLDLTVTNGAVRDFMNSDRPPPQDEQLFGRNLWSFYEKGALRKEQNFAFRNRDGLHFEEVSKSWGLDHVGVSYSSAVGDIDGDGDLDYVTSNIGEPIALYRNRSDEGNRISVRLVGRGGNRFGLGARVEIQAGESKQVRELSIASGYLSSDQPIVHFGLGEENLIDRLTVRWPGGSVQEFGGLAVGQHYTIQEPEDGAKPAPPIEVKQGGQTLFARTQILKGSGRDEKLYDDFSIQPLLPNKLSQLGPGMAWGDVDGDGDADVYFGRSAGLGGAIYFNEGGGKFVVEDFEPFDEHAKCEDMGALFFDADGDGDLDLFVASGSNEWPAGDKLYRDRLYLNDGSGKFATAPAGTLPDLTESSSAVSAADFDRDGDLDLFVGTRVIPGRYPVSPKSRLLRNEGGRFVDVTGEVAPELLEAGLVTGALWSDANGDGWIDLLLVREWGAPALFLNLEGKLSDRTEEAGCAALTGWWNGIAAGDVDGDGDLDYAVSNFGLNSKYRASREQPSVLFYGDLDGSGISRLVEAEWEGAKCYPRRGRSCSVHAMPSLDARFGSFKDFALASLEEIYPRRLLDAAQRFEASTLESGLLLNDGSGKFSFRPFPAFAQISAGFGVVLEDVDGDGILDCVLAQNFFHPQLETGALDGGIGLVLKGDGKGSFQPIPATISGIVVPHDARSLARVDVDGNGAQDLVFGVNGGDPQVYLSRQRGRVGVRLEGKGANRAAIGAHILLRFKDSRSQGFELTAGSSYLSQGPPVLSVLSSEVASLRIRWPDGTTSEHEWEGGANPVIIAQP